MASPLRSLLLLAFFSSALLATASAYVGPSAGRRTEIKGVESDNEVQDLGRFSVEQYNNVLRRNNGADARLLTFSGVESAQQQVVSGVKYYLRVAATLGGAGGAKGARRIYDAVVLVNPSQGGSRTLVSFWPGPHRLVMENNF